MTTQETRGGFGIGEAMSRIRDGQRLAREAWKPIQRDPSAWDSMYVMVMVPAADIRTAILGTSTSRAWTVQGINRTRDAMIVVSTRGGDRMPWTPDAKDLLGEDWYVWTPLEDETPQ